MLVCPSQLAASKKINSRITLEGDSPPLGTRYIDNMCQV